MVWFDFSGDAWLCVDTLSGGGFYMCLLGRCQDGLVLITREARGCVDTVLGGDFYRCLLGRCQDGLVLITREAHGQIQ